MIGLQLTCSRDMSINMNCCIYINIAEVALYSLYFTSDLDKKKFSLCVVTLTLCRDSLVVSVKNEDHSSGKSCQFLIELIFKILTIKIYLIALCAFSA